MRFWSATQIRTLPVQDINGLAKPFKYRFAVYESFKGAKASETFVTKENNMCEPSFAPGDELLIYASKDNGNFYTSTFCVRTTGIKHAQNDINFFRDILKGKPEPRIYGAVNLVDEYYATRTDFRKGAAGIKVIAKNESRSFETITDENGLYRFDKLPDGKYEVSPELPSIYSEDDSNYYKLSEINLRSDGYSGFDGYGIYVGKNAYSSIDVRWNNKVSGTIVDAEGKPLEKAQVTLIPTSQIGEPLRSNKTYVGYFGSRPADGELRKYEVKGRTPGAYVLAVEVFAPFVSGESPLLMYYPQETKADKAQVVTLSESGAQTLNIKLPRGYNLREIEGKLFAANGTPLTDGYVTLTKLEDRQDENNLVYESETAKNGKFKFQVFENAEYWVHAMSGSDKAKPFKIRIGKNNAPLKITILPTIPQN